MHTLWWNSPKDLAFASPPSNHCKEFVFYCDFSLTFKHPKYSSLERIEISSFECTGMSQYDDQLAMLAALGGKNNFAQCIIHATLSPKNIGRRLDHRFWVLGSIKAAESWHRDESRSVLRIMGLRPLDLQNTCLTQCVWDWVGRKLSSLRWRQL